jgi:hypothetical protein
VKKVDLVIGIDQYSVADLRNHGHLVAPGVGKLLQDFLYVSERNTGVVLLNFYRPLVHTFAHFVPLVDEHVFNPMSLPLKMRLSMINALFRIALYRFRRLVPEFNEQQIPMHTSCRNYPGKVYAGTDGFKNGMYLIQPNGKHCSECRCTPLLINHNGGTYFLTINGRTGWEDDRYVL